MARGRAYWASIPNGRTYQAGQYVTWSGPPPTFDETPPTFDELFADAPTTAVRRAATEAAGRVDQCVEADVRKVLAFIRSVYEWKRIATEYRGAAKSLDRLIITTEKALTTLIQSAEYDVPLVTARDFLRELVEQIKDEPRRPRGHPTMPEVQDAFADLTLSPGFPSHGMGIENDDARAMLRGVGAHLSFGRPNKRDV